MSMHLSVYIGPYLRVTGVERELVCGYEHLVCDAIGEAGTAEKGVRYLIANRKVPGIDRKMTISEHDFPEPMELPGQLIERGLFHIFAKPFIDAAESAGADVSVRWGIVCGIF